MTLRMLTAICDLLEEARKQGVDSTGYVHYIEQVKFAELEHELEKYCKKHGDFRWMPQVGQKGGQ